jgi:hypothetical protein
MVRYHLRIFSIRTELTWDGWPTYFHRNLHLSPLGTSLSETLDFSRMQIGSGLPGHPDSEAYQ